MNHEGIGQLVRYFATGGVIAAIGLTIYLTLAVVVGVWPLLANFVAYIITMLVGFFLHARISFQKKSIFDRDIGGSFLRFFAVSIFSLLSNSTFVVLFVNVIGWPEWSPAIAFVTLTPLLAFLLMRGFVFKEE